jgi:hypothetical protein
MSKNEILGAMTLKEAVAHWSDPRKMELKRWAETCDVSLQDLHFSHVCTYQRDRGEEATSVQVDAEIDALLALLKQIGCGDEIERSYRPLRETGELTPSEMSALSEQARKYIEKLKREISDLQAENGRMKNQIRKTNWGRSR